MCKSTLRKHTEDRSFPMNIYKLTHHCFLADKRPLYLIRVNTLSHGTANGHMSKLLVNCSRYKTILIYQVYSTT